MEIEKSDIEWFITLVVMILLAFIKPNKKDDKQKHTPKPKKRKRKR